MSLTAGARLGPYEVVSLIGAGGMGEVYKARDTRLNRTVAIKTLTQHISASSDLRKRFEREAQAVGALNHPHICVLHDIGAHEGIEYLVMELLEGDTLAARVSKGPLPLDQALRYAAEIADALDKAHRQGVLHRDLKPANIMITKSGAKLLDFGLAKLRESGAAAGAGQTLVPTMASGLTAQGTILGTLQYMAPEQLEGRDTDERADIFSFGAVVYEMLTGRKAFEGRSQASVIAAILDHEPPPISSLQPMTPPALDHLIRVCLAKDPSDRWQTAHDVLKQIEWMSSAGLPSAPTPAHKAGKASNVWLTATVLLALTTVLMSLAFIFRDVPPVSAARFTVGLPSNLRLLSNGNDDHHGVISPDGRYLVFSGADATTGKIMLYARPIDSVESAPIPGTDAGTYPFWSPDSRTIAFYAQGKLKRIDLNGGAPQVICDAPTGGWGGTWNRDDVILAGVNDPGPLSRVSARGGEPVPVTSLSSSEEDHDWPQFLPDGKHFLYVGWGGGSGTVYAASLDSQDRKLLLKGVSIPASYADPGYLLFVRDATLMAQPLDVKRLELTGEPFQLTQNSSGSSSASVIGSASASVNGVLTYRAAAGSAPDRLAWVGRDGRETQSILEPGYYADPALSPDGSRLAFAKKDSLSSTFDVWILELGSGTQRRLTFDPADDRAPVWSPDGRSVVFSSARKSGMGLYRKNANGAGDEELVAST